MNYSPLLSVLIPLYNCGKFIAQCLESIIAQDIATPDYEIIIVDDGSSDDGPATAAAFAGKCDNIRIYRQENLGVSSARNNALSHARGEYVTFVDADDMLVAGCLKTLLHTAREHRADVVKAAYAEVSEDATTCCCTDCVQGGTYVSIMSGADAIVNVCRVREGFCWGYLIRRSLIADNSIGFPDKVSFMEDWAFINQILLKCRTLAHTDLMMYLYRRNSSSCVANMTVEKIMMGGNAIAIVTGLTTNTEGEVRKKLTHDVCVNINVLLWFTIHYKQIYVRRKTVIKEVCRLLSQLGLLHVPPVLLLFRLFPDTFIRLRRIMASRTY